MNGLPSMARVFAVLKISQMSEISNDQNILCFFFFLPANISFTCLRFCPEIFINCKDK